MKRIEPERLVLAVDVVIFCIQEGRLMVLTYRRDNEPFKGAPALPGVAIHVEESLITAARRALVEKTAIPSITAAICYLEQLATFDGLYRDPRGRTISVAYMGIIREILKNSEEVNWVNTNEISKGAFPFDHFEILETAIRRLQGKLRYTNIAKVFLPETFRIEEIEGVYEAILRYPLNRTNFRNKLLKIGMIEQVSVLNEAVGKKGGRPPHLYRFTRDKVETVERDIL